MLRFRLPFLIVGLVALGGTVGCSGSSGSATEDSELRTRAVDEISFSLYNTATDKFPQTVSIKYRGTTEPQIFARCHQYRTNLDDPQRFGREALVCRDANLEVTIESSYGDEFTRYVRVRRATGGEEFLACRQTAKQDRGGESWDSRTDHVCTPKRVDAYGKALFDELDKPVVLEKYPTRTPFLPTLWTKSPPEAFGTYAQAFARAMPVGEYVGFGSSTSKKCKVKVASEGDGVKVSVHGLDENGAETRLRAQIVISSAMTFGAARFAEVEQDFSGKARPASVIVASSESETSTRDYFQRTLRVVRFHDAPASVDAGHTAILVDDDYCQRLSPSIPAW